MPSFATRAFVAPSRLCTYNAKSKGLIGEGGGGGVEFLEFLRVFVVRRKRLARTLLLVNLVAEFKSRR